jgi:hypothetical protein
MSRRGGRSRKQRETPSRKDQQRKSSPGATPSSQADQLLALQRSVGNRAVERLVRYDDQSQSSPKASDTNQAAPAEKSVDGGEQIRIGKVVENSAAEATSARAPKTAKEAAPKPKKKKAGVKSFDVDWSKNPNSSASTAVLRLDYRAKFKKDDEHDPSLAEFRQNVKTKYEITDGPNKGDKGDTSPMHDDSYSRADDLEGNAITDVDFYSNDNPGLYGWLDKDDDLNYAFTAEQMIIDTSQANKVIEKRGPATGTIKGKHPRKVSLPSRC